MADIKSLAVGSTTVGANFEQIVNTQGLGGRTIIASVNKGTGDVSEAELVALTKALASAGGSGTGTDTNGPDAFTVAGITAFDGTDPVYIALQGTGTLGTSSGDYVADITVAVVADFTLAN
jgi:hypothetical protein